MSTDQQPKPTLNQQIDSLNQSVLNLQALADRARDKGDFVRALELSNQSVELGSKLSELRTSRRGKAFETSAWQQLEAHLDVLNGEAKKTRDEMQSAQDNVENAKQLIGLVSKLAGVL